MGVIQESVCVLRETMGVHRVLRETVSVPQWPCNGQAVTGIRTFCWRILTYVAYIGIVSVSRTYKKSWRVQK